MTAKTCPCETEAGPTTGGDPLAAIPLIPGDIEMKRDSRGRLHLRIARPLRGLHKKVAAWLKYDYSRKLELDAEGTCYFDSADGARTLREIAARIAAQLGRDRRAMEDGVIEFTKILMRKNLIALKIKIK